MRPREKIVITISVKYIIFIKLQNVFSLLFHVFSFDFGKTGIVRLTVDIVTGMNYPG